MLPGEVVEDAVISALQHSPKGFNPVGMSLPADILPDRMLDGLMSVALSQPEIALVVVRVEEWTPL